MKIKLSGVSKVYKHDIIGIKDVSLEIEGGTFGLLGRNGAGKTTLMRILATLLEATKGEVLVGEFSVARDGNAVRQRLGYLPQDFGTYPNLTAVEFLDYMALLKGIKNSSLRRKEINKVLENVGLQDVQRRKLSTFSGGMRQRVGIAQALLGDPELLIVDEPTAGLDPEERVHFRNLLAEIGSSRTVILSTHIVGDIEQICKEIAVLKAGSIVYRGSVENLLKCVAGKVRIIMAQEDEVPLIKNKYCVVSTAYTAKGVQVRAVAKDENSLAGENTEATLEDAYLYIMGGMER